MGHKIVNMVNFYTFDSRLRSVRGGWGALPPAARFVVGLFALPGILLAFLSLVLFAVSILALLILTLPVYGLLSRLFSGGGWINQPASEVAAVSPLSVVFGTPAEGTPSGTRRVDSTVVE